jgi:ferritin-like metal-binding protein YciE
MTTTTLRATTLRDILIDELMEAYDADRQLLEAWPRLGAAAGAESLRRLCREGVDYTRTRVGRLSQAFRALDVPARAKACDAMTALIESAFDVAEDGPTGAVKDSALLAQISKISHYGLADYASAQGLAEACGESEVAKLMAESHHEKEEAIHEEAKMAEDEINPAAIRT